MAVLLHNLLHEPRVYEIPVEHGGAQHVKIGTANRVSGAGAPALRVHHRVLPRSITLMARGTEGDTSEPEPNEILEVEVIATAITARKLSATKLPDAPPAPPSEQVTEAPASEPPQEQ